MANKDKTSKNDKPKALIIQRVVGQSEQFKCRNIACDNMVKVNSGGVFCKKHRRKLGI